MLSSCLMRRKITESKNLKIVRIKTGRILLLSKCVVCNCKNRNLLNSNKLEDC